MNNNRTYIPGIIYTLFILCILPAGMAKADTIKPEKESDYKGLTASLSLSDSDYVTGEEILANITLTCTTEPLRLFNPFFNGLLDQPGHIRVFNNRGKLVSELLGSGGSSRRFPNEADWVTVYARCHVGRQLELMPCMNHNSDDMLPPGRYHMQLVLTGTLVGLKGRDKYKIIAASELVPFRIESKSHNRS